jgi:ABC-type antimicrobial peptide transport system permease subunit
MTRFGTFSKLAISQIIRNKRRTFGAIIGIVMAIILIVGSEVAINETATRVIKSKIERIPVDFSGYYYGEYSISELSNLNKIMNDVNSFENVESATLIGETWAFINRSDLDVDSIGNHSIYDFSIIVISEDSPYTRNLCGANESFGFSPGKFTIFNQAAKVTNITVGEEVSFLKEIFDYDYGYINDDDNYNITYSYMNLTCGKIIDHNIKWLDQDHYFHDDYYFEDYDFSWYWGYSDFSIFIDMETYISFLEEIQEEHFWDWAIYPEIYIWMDRDEIIDYENLDKTRSKIVKLQNKLDFMLRFDGEVYSNIIDVIDEQNVWLMANMLIYFAFSLPIMALGIYLGAISIDLGLEERKREIGILKSRGASTKQIYGYLLMEALILGLIAGFIGIILGIFFSNIFLMVFFTEGSNLIIQPFTGFNLSIGMILIGLGLGVLFAFVASYSSNKKISKLTIIESFTHYSGSIEEKEYKYGRDIILLSLGIFAFLMTIILDPSLFDYELGIFESILLLILMTMTYILMPLFPFFIVFSVTRLITKKTTRVYDYISRITKYLTKDLWYLINKNITRNPRRSIGITSIIALSLAFGIFINSTIDTNDVFNRRIIEAEVGSDILLEIDYLDSKDFYNISKNLTNIKGIDKITEAYGYWEDFPVPIAKPDRYSNLYLINISTYYTAVKPENYFFMGKNPKEVLSKLKRENSILIDDYYAKEEGYSIGDSIPMSFKTYNYSNDGDMESTRHYLNLKVVGIVRVLPGVSESIDIEYRESYNFIADVNSKLGKIVKENDHSIL